MREFNRSICKAPTMRVSHLRVMAGLFHHLVQENNSQTSVRIRFPDVRHAPCNYIQNNQKQKVRSFKKAVQPEEFLRPRQQKS